MPLRRGRRGRGQGDGDAAAADDAVVADVEAEDLPSGEGEADGGQFGEGGSVESGVSAPAPRRPLDESEAGGAGGDAIGDDTALRRVDLGSVRIPVLPDMEVRVELNEQREPVAASLLHGGSAVQILAFAAPRGDGIWGEVRAEIADSVLADGGEVEEIEGSFGPEIRVRVPNPTPGEGQPAVHLLRFVGFDGPRWFLRGVFSGPAATDPQQAAVLEAVLPQIVVARGQDPMAPRDPLPLRLPTDIAGMPQSPDQSQPPALDPFHRGPEITEIR